MVKTLYTPQYEYFRRLLINARTSASLTQAEVSLKLNRPQSFVAKYEGGERRLDVVEFMQICMALNIDAQAIVADLQPRISV